MDQIRDGDCNTKYFHAATIIQRKFNQVNATKDEDDTWCTNSNRIKQLLVTHFRTSFSEDATMTTAFRTRTTEFPRLTQSLVQALDEPFTKKDILLTLKGMQPFKAPGPDGFHAFFFQRYWHIVEDDVCQVVLQVLRS